jgi:hypothetical protein
LFGQSSNQHKRSATWTKLLRLASIILVALSFVTVHSFNVGQVGNTMQWKDGTAFISAGSHPAILVWDALAIVLFVTLMLRNAITAVIGIPSRGRRIAALLIDFWFSLLTLSGIDALVPLWLEAARTGHFAWHFQRDFAVSTDEVFALPSVLVFMALIVLYFVFPLTRGKQTVGCFIMRLKVTPPFGDGGCFTFRAALKRRYYEFMGLTSLLSRKWDRDEQGRTWYDIQTNCTVVLLDDN